MNCRPISDDAIDFGRCRRRRVRLLVPRGTSLTSFEVRELADYYRGLTIDRHGDQHAIAVMFYDDIFSPLGTLGSWDWCPGGVWGDAHKAKKGDYSHHRWVLDRSALMPAEIIKELLHS